MTDTPSVRFLFIDAMRGIAAMLVVLFHANEGKHIPTLFQNLPRWFQLIIENGNHGVAIFFVLSGFVISHSVYSYRVTGTFVSRFVVRRSLRLDPPYWVAIAVTLGFAYLSAAFIPDKASPEWSLNQIIAHFFYLQAILGFPHVNDVFWTLCLEVQFYLVYIGLLLIARNDPQQRLHGRYTVWVLGAAAAISTLWPLGIITMPIWPGLFLPHWHAFLLGASAYWTWRNRQIQPLFFVFVAVVAVASMIHGNTFSLMCATTTVLIFLVAVSGRLHTVLAWRWIQYLGLISYSLYLFHNPISGASFRVGYMLTGHSLVWEAVWWIMSIAACIVFSGVMWFAIERPSVRLSRLIRLKVA